MVDLEKQADFCDENNGMKIRVWEEQTKRKVDHPFNSHEETKRSIKDRKKNRGLGQNYQLYCRPSYPKYLSCLQYERTLRDILVLRYCCQRVTSTMRWSEPVWKALTLEISSSKLRVLTEKKSELIPTILCRALGRSQATNPRQLQIFSATQHLASLHHQLSSVTHLEA